MKLKCIYFLFLMTLWGSDQAFCQYFTIDTIKAKSPYNLQLSYIFPHLKSTANLMAAQQINLVLTTEILDVDHDMDSAGDYKSAFENVWGTAQNPMASLSDISFQVINNDSHFFCIGVSAEGCGAYCEHWTRYFTRESRTGNTIGLDDLFTHDGLVKLLDSVRIRKNKRIEKNIASIIATLNKKGTSEDDKQTDSMALEVYRECKMDSGHIEHEEVNFSLNKRKIIIYTDRCLPHVIRALDGVDYTFTFDLSLWRNELSDYGKTLLMQ